MSQSRTFVVVLMAALFAAIVPAYSQPAKSTSARVTIIGEDAGVVTTKDGAKSQRHVLIQLAGKTKVMAATDQSISALQDALLAEHRHLTLDFMGKAKDLIAKNDIAELKKAETAFQAASSEMLQHAGWYAVDGTLTQVGNELRMQGVIRVFAFKGADQFIGKRKAMVEGEAVAAGKDTKAILAIRNGDSQIQVIGSAADEHRKASGVIRVYGVLRTGETGSAVIEAERVEVIKK